MYWSDASVIPIIFGSPGHNGWAPYCFTSRFLSVIAWSAAFFSPIVVIWSSVSAASVLNSLPAFGLKSGWGPDLLLFRSCHMSGAMNNGSMGVPDVAEFSQHLLSIVP